MDAAKFRGSRVLIMALRLPVYTHCGRECRVVQRDCEPPPPGIAFPKSIVLGREPMCHLFAHQPQRDYESQTRSLRIGGHCTSIRLELSFWDTLEEIAARERMSLAKFLTT